MSLSPSEKAKALREIRENREALEAANIQQDAAIKELDRRMVKLETAVNDVDAAVKALEALNVPKPNHKYKTKSE